MTIACLYVSRGPSHKYLARAEHNRHVCCVFERRRARSAVESVLFDVVFGSTRLITASY